MTEKNIIVVPKTNLRKLIALLAVFLVAVPVATMSVESPASASGPTLNLPEAQTFATFNDWFDVVPADTVNVLSGFSGNVRAVLGVDDGVLRVKGSTFNSGTNVLASGDVTVDVPVGYRSPATFVGASEIGVTDLAVEGSIANVNAVLKNLQFKRSSAGGSTLSVSVVKAGEDGRNVGFDPDGKKYYEVVTVNSTGAVYTGENPSGAKGDLAGGGDISWEEARCRAKYSNAKFDGVKENANMGGVTRDPERTTLLNDRCVVIGGEGSLRNRTFNGLSGYLVNITSLEEHKFLRTRLDGTGWMGGSDIDVEGRWIWMDGPEAGEVFWLQVVTSGDPPIGATLSDTSLNRRTTNTIEGASRFNYWSGTPENAVFPSGEPNNSSGEHFAEFGFGSDGVGSSWNDCRNGCGRTTYIVEYGGMPGETADEQLQASVALNVAQNGPPTGVSASSGDARATVSWTASTIVIGNLDGYTVTADPGGATCTTTSTSCVVTGLTNGTEYTFTVTATFVGGSPSRTSVASNAVTPALAPPPPPPPPPAPQSPTPTPTVRPQAPSVDPTLTTPIAPTGGQVVLPPSRTPTPGTAPAPLAGPLPGASGNGGQAPLVPTALIGGRLVPVNTNVVNQNQVNLQTGGSSFGVSIPQGQGSVAAQGGNTELAVQSGAQTRLSGSGLFPGSTVQVFMPLGPNGSREIAQLPVGPSGTFDGDATFTTRPTDPPLPVGRNVLQIASLNEAGERVIIEMAINIAQSAPAPEILRTNGEIPGLTPGQSLATRAGELVDVRLTVDSTSRLTTVEGSGWSLAIDVDGDGNVVEETPDGGALISVVRGGEAKVQGTGFMPLTRADIWLFSDPTLLGSVDIDENGEFNGTVIVDGRVVPVGDHTLQIQGVGVDGFVLAANLGVVVSDADAESTASTEQAAAGVLWWVLALIVVLVIAVVVWSVVRRRRGQAY